MQLIKLKNAVLMKGKFVPVVLLFGFFFLIPPYLYSQDTLDTGFKYFKNYSYKEYDHQPQNWGMVQAQNGMIYVANQGGVLEYDGVSWRIIGIPGFTTVRSLAIDETGTIYIGGTGEIGYLAPDQKGSLQYVSLLDQLDENQRKFNDVWRTYSTQEGIYFITKEALLRWNPQKKQMKVWLPSHTFLNSFTIKGKLFVYQEKVGLMKMVNDDLVLFSKSEVFLNEKERIFMMIPFEPRNLYDIETEGKLLIGTMLNGFYLFDGITLKHFPTEVDEYLKKNIATHGIRLTSGDFALGTRLGGLVIMSPQGRLKYIFNETSGLQDNNIKYVMEDKQGNLWLCLDNGISKIEYASPFFIYDGRSGLPGKVLSVVRQQGDLYAGTTQTLYVQESQSKSFQTIPGISNSCWSLLAVEDSVLAATSDGVYQVANKNTIRRVTGDQAYVLLRSVRHPLRIWCGTNRGLVVLLLKNGQWVEENRIENINKEIRSIAEDQNGNVWLGTLTETVYKVDCSLNDSSPVVTRYDKSHGLSDGEVYVAMVAGYVLFATGKGIFHFDEKTEKFIPDETLGKEFMGGAKPVFRLIEDKNKNIWFHSESRNYQAISGSGRTYTIHAQPFRRIPTAQVNTIYPDPNGKSIWFANFDGLIRYDTTFKKNYEQDFQTWVRKVLTNNKLIFDGCKNKTGKVEKEFLPIIEYKDRNLLFFEFAAPFFEAEAETQYRCLLEGYDKDWFTWNRAFKRNYTNLDPGRYTFRVQAWNVYNHEGKEDIYRFKITLPWYKTWWAFLSYAVVFFALTYLINRWWRSIKLEHEKQKLEQVVKERTKEIQEKNLQLETQTLKLQDQSEKLKEMDKVKSNFFANISHEFRTPLTLIMSPLEQMLSDSRDKKQKSELNVMLRNSQQLLTLINQLLDLSRFDSGKTKLQASCRDIIPFLKGILAAFQVLAQQKQLGLEFEPEVGDMPLYFDAPKMEESMYNLLINAVKFTPPGGKITISTVQDQGHVKISVQDTGSGIPKDRLPYIFDRFYQADAPGGKGPKGTGIGLALTKEIIQLHYGKIDVHSQEGKGTEFVIRLPLGNDHLKPDEIIAVPNNKYDFQKGKEIKVFLPDDEHQETVNDEREKEGGVKHVAEPGEHEKEVILVVEDNPDVRKYIRDPLEPFYTVVEAADGEEGMAKAREIIPDLIVSDIMMPKADGYELCRELKKDIATSHIPIILLTAKASEESIIQGLETGADDYVTKPFNSRILLTRIKNLIDLRRQLQLKIQRQKMLLPSEITVSSMDDKFLKEFQDIIEKNISNEEFDVDKLCSKMYMGRSTLFRKVKALTGETPNQFILSYRLERGAQLLRENYGNVTEVAFAVGFSSSTYFATCFKDKFGQVPSSYQAAECKTS